MKILGIIPARAGSKGVPGKNIKILGDWPLIAYTIAQAKQSRLMDRIIVSSDDDKIIETALQYGAEVPFKRPADLATDTTSSIAVVQHAIAFLESQNECYDAVCLLQPTSPFREKGFIDRAITKFSENKCDALVSVLPVPQEFNPHWVFEPDGSGLLHLATGEKDIIKRRQELPTAFFRDGSVYLTKVETIKKGSFYGDRLSYIEGNPIFHANIDTPEDWARAEKQLPNILTRL